MSEEKDLSRRHFLKTGILAASALAVGGAVFGPKAATAAETYSTCTTSCEPVFPLPYVQLSVEQAKSDGYAGYGKGKCSYGAFDAIMKQLREKVGSPYTMIPSEIVQWGGTGGAGWATLCGALIGASTAINVTIGDKKECEKVVSELFGWYTLHEFPQFSPNPGAALEYEGEIAKSVAKSPLCHNSVSIWCKASGLKSEGKERSERCARLTADVAAKTVELLNAYHSQTFTAFYKDSKSVQECMTCHGKGRSLENTRGKMDCAECHTDVDSNNLLDHIKKSWGI